MLCTVWRGVSIAGALRHRAHLPAAPCGVVSRRAPKRKRPKDHVMWQQLSGGAKGALAEVEPLFDPDVLPQVMGGLLPISGEGWAGCAHPAAGVVVVVLLQAGGADL